MKLHSVFSSISHLSLWLVFYLSLWLYGCSSSMAVDQPRSAVSDPQASGHEPTSRPNILIAMSDDQSYPHTSMYGSNMVHTPGFDRVATEGILFHNGFAPAPGCAPSRASVHTGRHHWQNEEAGGHATLFPRKFVTYPDILEAEGYHIGFTGKVTGPNNLAASGRDRSPGGVQYSSIRYEGAEAEAIPSNAISRINYAANFKAFLEERHSEQPFYFFFGSSEPHRRYDQGSGLRAGKQLDDAEVPGFYPDAEEIRIDLLDYALEIEWFDRHLVKMLNHLEAIGELDNTFVLVTSDQGMPFPRAKANLYDFGLRVPLAVKWPARVMPGREVYDMVSTADIAPTLIEITGADASNMQPMTAKSLTDILFSEASGIVNEERTAVFAGMERHSSARWGNLGYPMRSMRTHEFLYIHNFTSERWPAGAPQLLRSVYPEELGPMYGLNEEGRFNGQAFLDIDPSPTKTFLIEHHANPAVRPFFELATAKRPAEELYDVQNDPYNIHNLADDPDYADILESMRTQLMNTLRETGDPRVAGPVPDVFENYQRFFELRAFPKPDWIIQE